MDGGHSSAAAQAKDRNLATSSPDPGPRTSASVGCGSSCRTCPSSRQSARRCGVTKRYDHRLVTERPQILGLRVLIARYVDASQPGWVECHFHDAAGQLWKILEKVPVVTDQDISGSTELPADGIVHCVEKSRRADESGRELVAIDTELPFYIEATDGTHNFEVLAEQLQELSHVGRVKRTTDVVQIKDIEHALVSSVTVNAQFAKALDVLLAYLLSNTPGFVTDGVLLEHVETDERQIVAAGVAILIEQTVEPLRIELNFDSSRTAVDTGALYFGDVSGPPISYGTPAHNRLSRKILANPDRDFSWRHSWHRTNIGWTRDPHKVT